MRFKIKGTRVRIGWTFFAVLSLMLAFSGDGAVLIAAASSFALEAGHIACRYALSGRAASGELGACGMRLTRGSDTALSYKADAACALAGPAVNLILALVLCFFGSALRRVSAINLALGIFNLLPVGELDGGRVLSALLCSRLTHTAAERVCLLVGVAVLIPVAFAGFYILIDSGYNFTLLAAAVYISIGLIMRAA